VDRLTEAGRRPSDRLIDHERAILNQDPALDANPVRATDRTRAAVSSVANHRPPQSEFGSGRLLGAA
jgi:hypothetical protein